MAALGGLACADLRSVLLPYNTAGGQLSYTGSPSGPRSQSRMAPTPGPTNCELCGRDKPLTFHHLIPKAVHGKRRYQKRHTKTELRSRGLYICRLCHNGIHDLIPERELADNFATREALLDHEGLARHIAWVKKQK